MFWDIALAVLAALAQASTGFLGWRVTMDGVQPERKRLYELLFALASVIGIVAVGLVAYRGTQISSDLAELRRGQQTTNKGIQEIKNAPPPVVNVTPPVVNVNNPPSPQHTHIEWMEPWPPDQSLFLPYHKDEVVAMNFGYKNVGDFPVVNDTPDTILRVIPTDDFGVVFKKYHHPGKIPENSGVLAAKTGEYHWHSFRIDAPLTQQQVDDLNAKRSMLCGIGSVRWKDDTGKYVTNLCECYFVGDAAWHLANEHNAEHKR